MKLNDEFYKILVFYIKNLKYLCRFSLDFFSAGSSWYIENNCLYDNFSNINIFFDNNTQKPRKKELRFSEPAIVLEDKFVYFSFFDSINLSDKDTIPFTLNNQFENLEENNIDQNCISFKALFIPKIKRILPLSKKSKDFYILQLSAQHEIFFLDLHSLFHNTSSSAMLEKPNIYRFANNTEIYLSTEFTFSIYYAKTHGDRYTQVGISHESKSSNNFDFLVQNINKIIPFSDDLDRIAIYYFDDNVHDAYIHHSFDSEYPYYNDPHSYILSSSESDFNASLINRFASHLEYLNSFFSSSFKSPEYIKTTFHGTLRELSFN